MHTETLKAPTGRTDEQTGHLAHESTPDGPVAAKRSRKLPAKPTALDRVLREKGVTNGQLSTVLSQLPHHTTVSRWRRGHTLPDALTRRELCDVLGVDYRTLWGVPTASDDDAGALVGAVAALWERDSEFRFAASRVVESIRRAME